MMLRVFEYLVRIDLDETLTRLYTTTKMFHTILSNYSTVKHLGSVFGIHATTFPMLCLHLSIRGSKCRLPQQVALLLAVRYNYPLWKDSTILSGQLSLSTSLIVECCKATSSQLARQVLGLERVEALLTGRATRYTRGIVICLGYGGYYDSIAELFEQLCQCQYDATVGSRGYDAVDIRNATDEYMEILVCMSMASSRCLPIFTSKVLNNQRSYEGRAFIRALCRNDRLYELTMMSLRAILEEFDCLASTKVFTWLYTEHGYTSAHIKGQYYPYRGSMLPALESLYRMSKESCVSDEVITAVIMSDDIESLIWLGERGDLSNKDYCYLRPTGITKETLESYQGKDACSVM